MKHTFLLWRWMFSYQGNHGVALQIFPHEAEASPGDGNHPTVEQLYFEAVELCDAGLVDHRRAVGPQEIAFPEPFVQDMQRTDSVSFGNRLKYTWV